MTVTKKQQARLTEETKGDLSYIKQWELTITDAGTGTDNIDFTAFSWEYPSETKPSHLTIVNKGSSNDLYIVFDAEGSTIDTSDRTTYNFTLDPYEEAELDGNCSSIGMKCASGLTTTVKIRAW